MIINPNPYCPDFILDTVVGAALECKRNGLRLVSSDDDEYIIKRNLTKLINRL